MNKLETCDGKSGDGITHHNACECRERYFEGLIRELEAARGALKFYGNPESYVRPKSKDARFKLIPVMKDKGEKAREALQSPKEPK